MTCWTNGNDRALVKLEDSEDKLSVEQSHCKQIDVPVRCHVGQMAMTGR
jgi:hypothetical protein